MNSNRTYLIVASLIILGFCVEKGKFSYASETLVDQKPLTIILSRKYKKCNCELKLITGNEDSQFSQCLRC